MNYFENIIKHLMLRTLRIQYPDAWYHVLNRARRDQDLFPAKADMGTFLDLLKETATMFNLKVSDSRLYCSREIVLSHFQVVKI